MFFLRTVCSVEAGKQVVWKPLLVVPWALSYLLTSPLYYFYFIFQGQFTFNITLYLFQVLYIVVIQSYLQSGPPNISGVHLAPYIAINNIIGCIPCAVVYIARTIL